MGSITITDAMWPFINKRKAAIRQLSRFVSPDVAEEILNNPEAALPPPRQLLIGYNIIQVRDDDVERLNNQIARITEFIFQNRGVISDKTLSLLVITFGAPVPAHADPAEASKSVAMQLVETFANDVKVVYGSGNALVGSWGDPPCMSFGPMFPLFSQRLEVLCQMDYGSLREMNL